MIKTEQSYKQAKKHIKSFQRNLDGLEPLTMSDLDYDFEHNSIRHVVLKMEAEVEQFETALSGKMPHIDNPTLENLHEVLILCRIAKGVNIEDLAKEANLSTEMLMEHERDNFENCPWWVVQNITDILGIKIKIKFDE